MYPFLVNHCRILKYLHFKMHRTVSYRFPIPFILLSELIKFICSIDEMEDSLVLPFFEKGNIQQGYFLNEN